MTYRLELETYICLDVLREAIECGREAFLCYSSHNSTPMYEEIYMQAARDYCLGQKLSGDFDASKDIDANILIGILAFPVLDLLDPEHWPDSVMKVMAEGVPHLKNLKLNTPLLEQMDDLKIPSYWVDILIYVGFAEMDGSNAAIPPLHTALRHAARLTLRQDSSSQMAEKVGFLPKTGPDGLRYQ